MTDIGYDAFSGCNNVKLYANRGTDGLLAVWKYGMEPYETGTTQQLWRPSISATPTQTTIRCQINNRYPEFEYSIANSESVDDNEFLIKGLKPGYGHVVADAALLQIGSGNSNCVGSSSVKPRITSTIFVSTFRSKTLDFCKQLYERVAKYSFCVALIS